MKTFFDFINGKQFLAVLFSLMCALEIWKGFLKPFPAYVKTCSLKKYILPIAAAFLGVFLLMPFDAMLIQAVQKIQNNIVDRLILFGAFLGKTRGTWGPLAVLYFVGLVMKSEKTKNLFFGAVLSSALTGLAAHLTKFLTLRARPYNDLGPFHFFDWTGFAQNHRAFQSFPSGDVAIVSGAAVFLFYSRRCCRFSWLFLLLPFLTALSRMDLNKHWPSDTLFSFLISFAVAKFVRDYLDSFKGARLEPGTFGQRS